ncbi:hypothetical protein BLNAU_4364 [Blattamonas nauphoetae]|uniref:Uncharacterized protein n=1 Tax=Blattamonas nauphoetae TaxID=2049346 RepID=A0ABQ9YAR3_9EUKA|nr:hypothetical protein BLNAU_4364 [Blattamonas nauphoetae]
MFCQFFLHQCRTLNQLNRLIIPLDPDNDAIAFAQFMIALIKHFEASGDLILPNSSPEDHLEDLAGFYLGFYKEKYPRLDPFLLFNLAYIFKHYVLLSNNQNYCFQTAEHSFLRRDDVEYSDQLLDVVKKIKETHSLEAVRNAYYDWDEWMTMMEEVELGVVSLTDLSFLQSRCFRQTLEALQTKHQLRATGWAAVGPTARRPTDCFSG